VSLREVRAALETWAERGDPAAVATLIDVRRSAPRGPGARFAVSGAGELAGSVSSGCVEGDLHGHLEGLLAGGDPRIVTYGITDEMAAGVGLSCGGEIDVLVERHRPDDPVWGPLAAALDGGLAAALVTGVSAPIRARRLVVTGEETAGTLGSEALDLAAREAAAALGGRTDACRVRLVEGDEDTDAFIETFAPPPRLLIVGATPIAEALCGFAATCGFAVSIVDPRAAFARKERFPAASGVLLEWPDEAIARVADRHTSVVVLTHDAKLDLPALEAALDAGCAYIGLLGGGRTQRQRREALSSAGRPAADVDRVKGPVGLDIGARSPQQIAVSILAELIAEGRAP